MECEPEKCENHVRAKNTRYFPDFHLASIPIIMTHTQGLEEAYTDSVKRRSWRMRTLLREPFELLETHALQRLQSKLSQDLNHSLALDFLQASQAVHFPRIQSRGTLVLAGLVRNCLVQSQRRWIRAWRPRSNSYGKRRRGARPLSNSPLCA